MRAVSTACSPAAGSGNGYADAQIRALRYVHRYTQLASSSLHRTTMHALCWHGAVHRIVLRGLSGMLGRMPVASRWKRGPKVEYMCGGSSSSPFQLRTCLSSRSTDALSSRAILAGDQLATALPLEIATSCETMGWGGDMKLKNRGKRFSEGRVKK
jgi:hypothetical protein